jgi:PAS domain-containing protein
MRQWELIGITDQVSVTSATQRRTEDALEGPAFFWTTDGALRLRGMSESAAEAIGRSVDRCLGRDLLDVFGLDGPNAGLLDAHITALSGDTAMFTFRGDRVSVRCLVQPVTDAMGRVSGTYCLATRIENVDIRDEPDRSAVA